MAEPEYVSKLVVPPFDWNDEDGINISVTGPNETRQLVEDKYTATMVAADEMLTRLVGEDGDGGYLKALSDAVAPYAGETVGDYTVTVPDILTEVENRPAPDLTGLDLDFPEFDKAAPQLRDISPIDLSQLSPGTVPDSITAAIEWAESGYDTTLFDALFSRIITDLQSGATGLDAEVEQEIYDRAVARQEDEEDDEQQAMEDYYAASGFTIPQGSKDAAFAHLANKRAARREDLNGKIIVEQAELAQRNSQFIISTAKELEAIIRDYSSKQNDRALDKAKSVAQLAVSIFAEEVRAFGVIEAAKKDYIIAQVENLRASVEYNKGLVESFKAEVDANNAIIEGKSKKNDSIVRVYEGEVAGYEAETKAEATMKQVELGRYELLIKNADMQLRTAIANVEASIKGYETESSIKERISADIAQIAMQAIASAWGAVNMSAGISHSTSQSESESTSHGESRSMSYGFDEGLRESHSYEHDPAA